MFHCPSENRIRVGNLASTDEEGNNGAFYFPTTNGRALFVVASDGRGWEHVSVHAVQGKKSRTPTWNEMCAIKGVFWDEEDWVMQFHPAKSEYVNMHPNTLHLWRPTGDVTFPTPASILVGLKPGEKLNAIS